MGQIEKELYQGILSEDVAFEMVQVGIVAGLEIWV